MGVEVAIAAAIGSQIVGGVVKHNQAKTAANDAKGLQAKQRVAANQQAAFNINAAKGDLSNILTQAIEREFLLEEETHVALSTEEVSAAERNVDGQTIDRLLDDIAGLSDRTNVKIDDSVSSAITRTDKIIGSELFQAEAFANTQGTVRAPNPFLSALSTTSEIASNFLFL